MYLCLKKIPTKEFTNEMMQHLILLQNNPLVGRRGKKADHMLGIVEVMSLVDTTAMCGKGRREAAQAQVGFYRMYPSLVVSV